MRPLFCSLFIALAASPAVCEDQVAVSSIVDGLRPAYHVAGTPEIRWTLEERMAEYGVPGVSVAILHEGEVVWASGFGVLQAGGLERVDEDTVFSVGSLSKVGAAVVILRMVDEGRLELDRDVNDYLTSWKIPTTRNTRDAPVTLRALLSHTSGANVRGFPDFLPDAPLPGIIDTLEGRAPSLTGPVRIVSPPGLRSNYSGGGVTIEQLIVEDVLGISFEAAARRYLFEPLHMARSTYAQPLDPALGNIAKAHDSRGAPAALPRGYETMPETAASGLWTTPGDYARMVGALIRSYRGETGFLSPSLARAMMTEIMPGPVGLGPFLEGRGFGRRFFHTGSNDSYKAWMEGNLATGDGVVVFTNGARGANLYKEIRRSVAAAENWPSDRVVELPGIELTDDFLATLEGVYSVNPSQRVVDERMNIFPWPALWRISTRAGGLHLTALDGEDEIDVIPADRHNFVFSDDGGRWIEFLTGRTGKIEGLVFRNGTSSIEATKVAIEGP